MNGKPATVWRCIGHSEADCDFADRHCNVCTVKKLQQTEAELYETKERLWKAERELEKLGFRRCDIPACNCNGYHQQREEPEV